MARRGGQLLIRIRVQGLLLRVARAESSSAVVLALELDFGAVRGDAGDVVEVELALRIGQLRDQIVNGVAVEPRR